MENKKIYTETYNNKKELVFTDYNGENAKNKLMSLLYDKLIVKSRYIKNIQYQYNYADLQKVTFIYDNGYREIFYNIPTKMGTLDITRL